MRVTRETHDVQASSASISIVEMKEYFLFRGDWGEVGYYSGVNFEN